MTTKTHQQKYRDKTCLSVSVSFKKDFVNEFREACISTGVTQARVIRSAMEKVISDNQKKDSSFTKSSHK